jgi:hypothetical protein
MLQFPLLSLGTTQKIVEKFNRNEQKDAYHDVATRHFNRSENRVFVQFHYASDAITATTKTFIKPPRSEKEAKFEPGTIKGYVANPWAKQMNNLEQFYLLRELMGDEERSVDCFHARDTEIKEILHTRRQQIARPLLKFSIFDPLRNESARKMRLQRVSSGGGGMSRTKKFLEQFSLVVVVSRIV